MNYCIQCHEYRKLNNYYRCEECENNNCAVYYQPHDNEESESYRNKEYDREWLGKYRYRKREQINE
jgi:hypothetical protein